MRRMVLNREQAAALIAETVEKKLFERRMRAVHTALVESRSDLESKQIIAIFEEYGGVKVEDPMTIDEGMWEKAKHMLSKIRIGGASGSTTEEGELQDLADKAATKEFKELFAQIKQSPGFGDYPNNEKQEEFEGITAGLVMLRQALDSGHKAGLVQTDTANELIDKVKSYLGKLNKDLSYSYRYLKEDDDEVEAGITQLDEDLDEILSERAFTNFNRFKKLYDIVKGGGELKPRQARWMDRVQKGLEKEIGKKGKDHLTGKENTIAKMLGIDKPAKGGGGPGPKPKPEIVPEPEVPDPEPEVPDVEPDLGTSDLLPQGAKSTGIGDIGGMQDIGRLYRKAGSTATLMSWLGPGFLKSLAGFALPVAGIGAVVGLVGKRLAGHSREGGLKTAAKMMTPLDAAEYNSEPQKLEKDPAGGDPEAAAGKGDIYVQRNPEDGKGLQSQFASAGVKGKDMSGLMKGLRKDLSAAGFNVLEEAKRETISLVNTLAALEQMEDPQQKEVVKKALVDMLRQNKIRVDPQSSQALRAGAAGEEEEEFQTAAAKWVAAGKPEITDVSGNNVVTRDGDNYADAKAGILKPDALELAKAQLAWLQKNKASDPNIGLLTTAIQTTEGAGGAEGEGGAHDPTDVPLRPEEGGEPPPPVGGAAAGGDVAPPDSGLGGTSTYPEEPAGEEDDPAALARAKARGSKARGRVRGRSGMEENAKNSANDKMVNERFDSWKRLAGIIKG